MTDIKADTIGQLPNTACECRTRFAERILLRESRGHMKSGRSS